jgi:FolB domain-containing protein
MSDLANHDFIEIRKLRLPSKVGVPDEERATAQCLSLTLRLFPDFSLTGLDDDISRSIDYAKVTQAITNVTTQGERKLIETLAEEIASTLHANFPLQLVEIQVEKQILPHMQSVTVCLHVPKSTK